MGRKLLRYALELMLWPLACLACMQGGIALGLLDGHGWDETLALWKDGVRRVEERGMTVVDRMLREKVDPVLVHAVQHAEARLNETVARLDERPAPLANTAVPAEPAALPRSATRIAVSTAPASESRPSATETTTSLLPGLERRAF